MAVFQVEANVCLGHVNMTDLPAGIDCTAANMAIRAKAIKRFFISWLVDVSVNLTRIHYVNKSK